MAGLPWFLMGRCACPMVFSVSLATGAVRLIFAGWLPQDGLFGWNGSRVYE